MLQGRSWGRQFKTSLENSEKSTSYSVRMPSVSGSISPACPKVFASLLKKEKQHWGKPLLITTANVKLIIWRKYRLPKSHPSAKLLSADHCVIRQMKSVFSKSPGLEIKSAGQSARGTLTLGTRWSTGENIAKFLLGRNLRKPDAALECFFSTMNTT